MANHDISSNIQSGSKARLIPVVADSKKEERATSVLLSTFMLVPQYAERVLADVGVRVGVSSDIKCYTEVVFKTKVKNKIRPDGLITITTRGKTWSALIESKIGNNVLDKEQVEAYLDLAKEVGANALITISNQFAIIPTHHPIVVSKNKTRSVELYHFSWLSLLSKASIISGAKSVDDREQAFVLRELIRYMDHPYSGVAPMSAMNPEWKELCVEVQQGAVLKKSGREIEPTAMSWQQLLRYMTLELSTATNSGCDVYLTRAHAKDPQALLQATIDEITKKQTLSGSLVVPNAAGPIDIVADIARKVLILSIRVNGPQNKTRATASINWLTRQIKDMSESDLILKVIWPGMTSDTQCSLGDAIEDPTKLVPDGVKGIPKAFEVIRVIDMGAKFKGQKVFVETSVAAVPLFYRDAGQNLTKWVAPPPKTTKEEKTEDESIGNDAQPSTEKRGVEIMPTWATELKQLPQTNKTED